MNAADEQELKRLLEEDAAEAEEDGSCYYDGEPAVAKINGISVCANHLATHEKGYGENS